MTAYYKKAGALLAAAAVFAAAFSGCAAASSATQTVVSQTQNTTTAETTAAAAGTLAVEYSDRDLDGSWDAATAVAINCSGDTAEITGSGASIKNGVVTISQAGTYLFTGTLSGGIVVAAADSDKVQIVLNGVSVTAADGPAICVQSADKVFLTLAEGTINSVSDTATYTLAEGEDEPNACIYSKSDLTINGAGTLSVTGNYNHGIYCKDELKITGGTLTVNAANDGIKGKDCVAICAGDITITAGGDGIQSNNTADTTLGWVCITDAVLNITADGDGIQAETVLELAPQQLNVNTGGGSANAAVKTGNDNFGRQGSGTAATTTTDTTSSAKGLKAGTLLVIDGGIYEIDSADDAVHSNGDVTVTGGTLSLATGDDGIHADDTLDLTGGSILITASYEGLEGMTINVSGGEINLTSSDDGLNAAGGNDSSGFGGSFGQDTFSSGSSGSSPQLNISGGTLIVNAGGDGLDSNGTMTISGGLVLVSGPTDSGNGALDTGTTAVITGGTVIAAGSSGMAINFDSNSTQGSWLANTGSQAAGTLLTLTDSSGKVLLSWAPAKTFACVVVSCPGMVQGGSYTLSSGGTVAGADENGYAASGTLSGGTSVATTTLSSLTVSDISGMGGGMGGGAGGMGNNANGGMPGGKTRGGTTAPGAASSTDTTSSTGA